MGKTTLLTGATNGIGFEAVKPLGAHEKAGRSRVMMLTCRICRVRGLWVTRLRANMQNSMCSSITPEFARHRVPS